MVGGVIQPLIFNILAHLIWFDMVFIMCNTRIIKKISPFCDIKLQIVFFFFSLNFKIRL